ncbi:MAG: hypothetical protein KFF68_07695 [Desulfosarcina sp.]|nr:hypothetical protein [Desulfosarcina sp.]
MKRGVRRILAVTIVLCIGLAVAAAWFLAKAMPIGTGYVAKYLCTSTFLSKRDPQVVFVEDIKPVNPLAKLVSWDIDTVGQSVTATALKVFQSKAIFRQGCGCTLLAGTTEASLTYTTTPTPKAPKGEYGALFWLNAGEPGHPDNRLWPHVPMDAYAAQGFQEQKVIVIPSKKLVLVRFGATAPRSAWDTDAFIADVIRALPV